ncbi:M23 family metallopeptidase [Cupriavidus gilardii]|uniref:M23 family metallopeptidase n=1 Tax=Cupriavidus gilardii TaxID=82541 RepID=A0A6N1BG64_9BURK|nr:M23 family metallopeptidase [Cupriavidus gilardii]QQE07279.1 M23 family metallopeptidase [Cupriavidus sp. ISTL7]KAB0598937.1 M23 family metallopeptidase [Cupriavidus gilardii]MCT9016045.1 M23 family metallopeptidase [Cupriavidus gilardii]MCT9055815.1 M23 family metallopeptidase [Cupriavidus gilardii]MCT9073896.1 M23 family metallopeptidase [Cupriavidus gilardii]
MWSRLREVFARELVVLVDPTHALHARRRKQLTASVATVFTLGMAAAMGVAPRTAYDDPDAPRVVQGMRLPDLRDQLERLTDTSATFVRQERMQRGDTIATLLKRLGVDDPDAQAFIHKNPTARGLFKLEPGQIVQAEVDQSNLLVSLQANLGGDVSISRQLVIERAGDLADPDYKARIEVVQNELHYEMGSGTIGTGGFFKAMDAANVPDEIVDQMISIFSGVIDFHHDIVKGDRFRIVYESGYRDGAFVRNGRVVAIELINRNQLHQALWYAPDGKNGAYYTFDGRSMKRPFLRSPVEFSRMSSGFGGRNHPLHHQWLQHKGVDFAAPTGTKVFATGDGEVDFVGQQNGYGNIVVIKHHNGYSTYYAHLSRFAGIQQGQRVMQGQLIGYVGSTGWATGPHLHYEFRHNDVPQNPLTITLMESPALTGRARQQFLSYTSDMLSRINALRTYNVASNGN